MEAILCGVLALVASNKSGWLRELRAAIASRPLVLVLGRAYLPRSSEVRRSPQTACVTVAVRMAFGHPGTNASGATNPERLAPVSAHSAQRDQCRLSMIVPAGDVGIFRLVICHWS